MEFEERVLPELRPIFELQLEDFAASLLTENVPITRKAVYDAWVPREDPEVRVYEKMIPRPEGGADLRLRIYEPMEKKGVLPGILHIPSGGFSVGVPEALDEYCYILVKEINCVIVAPAHRLAPEAPFPAGVDDCYTALVWMNEYAEEAGIDPQHIAVTGASGGGGLTVAVCLMARDRKGPRICFQAPLYPTMDDRMITKAYTEQYDRRTLTFEACENVWNTYLGEGHKKKDVSPYASPARAKDYLNMPPAFTFVGALDIHRDDVMSYVSRLCEAEVPVEFILFPGCFHGFDRRVPNAPVSQRARKATIRALNEALHR